MECPKCSDTMQQQVFGTDIEIQRCSGCGGLFCQWQTLHRLRDEWLADTVLDNGNPALGARHNQMRDIACPACGQTMDHVQDHTQSHITLDSCGGCDGVFLDAGELTDMKSVTLMDHVRKLLTRLGR